MGIVILTSVVLYFLFFGFLFFFLEQASFDMIRIWLITFLAFSCVRARKHHHHSKQAAHVRKSDYNEQFPAQVPAQFADDAASLVDDLSVDGLCKEGDCQNGGVCTWPTGCVCRPGYSGTTCEEPEGNKATTTASPTTTTSSVTTPTIPAGMKKTTSSTEPTCCEDEDCASYRGSLRESVSGLECIWWAYLPPDHKNGRKKNPDSGLDGNYCRNPSGHHQAWCYVVKNGAWVWENCDMRSCTGGSCISPSKWDENYLCMDHLEPLLFGCHDGTCFLQCKRGKQPWCYPQERDPENGLDWIGVRSCSNHQECEDNNLICRDKCSDARLESFDSGLI